MVASIRELVNIQFSTSAFNSKSLHMTNSPSYMDIDVDYNIIRRRSTFSNKINLREPSVILNMSTTSYCERMEINNNLLDEDIQDPINSFQKSYNDSVKEDNLVKKATNNYSSGNLQCVQNKILL